MSKISSPFDWMEENLDDADPIETNLSDLTDEVPDNPLASGFAAGLATGVSAGIAQAITERAFAENGNSETPNLESHIIGEHIVQGGNLHISYPADGTTEVCEEPEQHITIDPAEIEVGEMHTDLHGHDEMLGETMEGIGEFVLGVGEFLLGGG